MKETSKKTNKKAKEKVIKERDNNYLFIGGLILVILVSFGFTIYTICKNVNKNKDNQNDSSEVFKETKVGDLTVKSAYVSANGDLSEYNAILVNDTSANYYVGSLYVTFTVNGKEVKGLILEDTTFKPNEEVNISFGFTEKLDNITKVSYEIK